MTRLTRPILLSLCCTLTTTLVVAFSPTHSPPLFRSSPLTATPTTTTTLLTNPFAKLPWNVARAQARQARQLELERAALHRQLGIPEDASYEDICATTDLLLSETTNVKARMKIEIAKDKILQIRLAERVAGYAQDDTLESRAQSRVEAGKCV